MGRRNDTLTLAVLGLLAESPMHGYELRKRLAVVLGPFRAFSYGSLYPCLKALVTRGWITESDTEAAPPHALSGRRARIVYQLTAEGKERLAALLAQPGPSSWEDERFDIHFAFFSRTDAATRLRILEGRRTRMQERLEGLRQSTARTRERLDGYTLELQRHGLDIVEREVRWLDGLIEGERRARAGHGGTAPGRDRSHDRSHDQTHDQTHDPGAPRAPGAGEPPPAAPVPPDPQPES